LYLHEGIVKLLTKRDTVKEEKRGRKKKEREAFFLRRQIEGDKPLIYNCAPFELVFVV